ncbi:uncharacterized protein LOC144101478 [Amblyomma americanum]
MLTTSHFAEHIHTLHNPRSQGLLHPVALGKLTEQMKPASTSEKLSSPRRPLRHGTLSRQKDVGGGLFPRCLPLSPIRLMYSSPLAASFRMVHEEPELEYRAAASLRCLCLKRYHHVGASDSRDPLHLSHSRDGEGERL